MKNINSKLNKTILSVATAIMLSSSAYANCTYELFTISSSKGTTITDFVEQLSDECSFSIIVTDPEAQRVLDQPLNKTNLKNLTIDEVLALILKENNLNYSLEDNILKISYLKTKTFNIDYIISQRKSTGSTDVSLSSVDTTSLSASGAGGLMGGGASGGASGGGAGGASSGSGNSNSKSGTTIETTDEVKFWEELDLELQRVMNRPEDNYQAESPIINKNAGMITVTGTVKQLDRLGIYLETLQKKVSYQVLIDVKMYAVLLDNSRSTGIDWKQLYSLQNMTVDYDGAIDLSGNGASTGPLIKISGSNSISEVVKFLDTQGDVQAISNPKILTLNNQPALITVGTEFFYKISQASNQQGTGGGVAATVQQDIISSVFAGVLLDITPEISDDSTITLKINPSISETREADAFIKADPNGRTIPPDLNRRQLSSVVTVKDGHKVILGGLISTKESKKTNKVPLLGDIPGISYFFRYDEKIKQVEELVIIIEPHIIKADQDKFSLSDLGYTGITHKMTGLPGKDKEEDSNNDEE